MNEAKADESMGGDAAKAAPKVDPKEFVEKMQAAVWGEKESHKGGTCPSCGYCSHCGRGRQSWPTYPYRWPTPYWQTTPYVQYQTAGTTNANSSSGY